MRAPRLSEDGLHLFIDLVGLGLGAVAHEADGGLAVIVVGCGVDDRLGHRVKVAVDVQQGLGQDKLVKGVGVCGELVLEIVVLKAVHQVGRLHDQGLDAVVDRAFKRLAHIVDDLSVAVFHMVNDDLACEGAADAPIGKRLLQGALDRADGQAAAVVVAGAKGHDEKLTLPDIVGVAGIVQRRVAGLVIFFVFGFSRRFLRRGACCQRTHDQGHCQQQGKNFLEIHVFLLILPRHMNKQTRRYNQFLVVQGRMPLYQGRQVS